MADLNKVMIIGNVGKEPEMRFTANGSAMTTFSVATNRNFRKPDGEWDKETEWFSVVTWNQLAERCSQILQRGSRVYVEGRMQTRSWDGQDGQRRYKTELVAMSVLPQDRRQPVAAAVGTANDDAGMIDPDDLPFE
ncbi:MAG: single-stranded DNA-binding protein [Dehalococcoidia bacterium]